jgi:hypothetical protein
VLTLGVTTCTLTALIFLPAILTMLPLRNAEGADAAEGGD